MARLDSQQLRLLQLCDSEEWRSSALVLSGTSLYRTRQAMNRVLSYLMSRGLVERRPAPGRESEWRLTAAGLQAALGQGDGE
jgi:hypothetical protein